jgi:hypothetical protein
MGLVLAFVAGTLLTYAFQRLARRHRKPEWVALIAPITFSAALWVAGSEWVSSPQCSDIQTCDSGGWLAFSASIAIVATVSVFGGVVLLVLAHFGDL